jgi:uncharacterized protein
MYKSILEWMKQNPIPAFFLLTFIIAWLIWLPIGYLAPSYFLLAVIPGAWAPTIVSVLLTWLTDGKGGVRQFLSRVVRWRVGFQWYLVVFFGIALIAFAAQGLNIWLFDGEPVTLSLPAGVPEDGLLIALPIIFFVNIFFGGPLAEDIGWRGYALPKLREKMSTFTASLLIGIVWVLWHLPFFWIPEGRIAVGGIPLLWFALLTTAWSVLFAWVYVNTESILMPVLFHAAVNTTLGTLGVLSQTNGNLMPLRLNTLLTWIVAIALLLINGWNLKTKQTK